MTHIANERGVLHHWNTDRNGFFSDSLDSINNNSLYNISLIDVNFFGGFNRLPRC